MSYKLLFLILIISSCSFIDQESIFSWRKTSSDEKKVLHKKSGYLFDPNDTSCDGHPILPVETMEGTCLGMVLSNDNAKDEKTNTSFVKPRTIVQIPKTDQFLVLDMGGWRRNNGRLFLLRRKKLGDKNIPSKNRYLDNPYEIRTLKLKLDTPHGLRVGRDGFFYIGERHQISRFKLNKGKAVQWTSIIQGLPNFKGHLHPLTEFLIDPRNGDFYINSGAPSDHCFLGGEEGDYKECPESEAEAMAAIYRVPYEATKKSPTLKLKKEWLVARGLRNSMAMAIHPSGFLVQGENGRDFPELGEPYEEINVLDLNNLKDKEGKVFHYGWPYCYNFNATSPEWDFEKLGQAHLSKPVDCQLKKDTKQTYKPPYTLMPPHVAPLHMNYYKEGEKGISALENNLIISWHGHQPTGNRLVAYPHDDNGLPLIEENKKASYNIDTTKGCTRRSEFRPHGEMLNSSDYKEVISGWGKIAGLRPEGAPVGFSIAEDGSIWIVEDRNNRSVLRLARYDGPSYKDDCSNIGNRSIDPKIELFVWRDHLEENTKAYQGFSKVREELINNSCLGCHGNLSIDDIDQSEYGTLDFLVKNEWIVPGDREKSKLYGSIAHLPSYTPMPPRDKLPVRGTPEGDELIEFVGRWIDELPSDISESFKQVKLELTGRRNIRNAPTTKGSRVCGRALDGDIFFIDSRESRRVFRDGHYWVKLLMAKGHARLNEGACKAPLNGVYYLSIGKNSDGPILHRLE